MKQCFKCKETKPIQDFYQHKAMSDGHLNKCKECTKSGATKHRINNIEKVREYDRTRAILPHRLALNIENTRNSRLRPGYRLAHGAVAKAVKNGSLKKMPCQMCGTELGIHAHHDDYSQPLNVMWLCVIHHKARHAYLEYIEQKTQEAA